MDYRAAMTKQRLLGPVGGQAYIASLNAVTRRGGEILSIPRDQASTTHHLVGGTKRRGFGGS